jgi:hypothetical protein
MSSPELFILTDAVGNWRLPQALTGASGAADAVLRREARVGVALAAGRVRGHDPSRGDHLSIPRGQLIAVHLCIQLSVRALKACQLSSLTCAVVDCEISPQPNLQAVQRDLVMFHICLSNQKPLVHR